MRSPSSRRLWSLVWVLGLLVSSLVLVASPAGAVVAAAPNPDVDLSCPIDVVVVVDGSSSVAYEGFTEVVRDGLGALLSSLEGDARVAVVQYGSKAALKVPYTAVDAAWMSGPLGSFLSGYAPRGNTNLHAGLLTANGYMGSAGQADVVVVVSNGTPNVYLAPWGAAVRNSNLALDRAVTEANTAKTNGSHMLAIGFDGADVAFLSSLSGPDVYGPGGNPGTDDVAKDDDLPVILGAVGEDACGGSAEPPPPPPPPPVDPPATEITSGVRIVKERLPFDDVFCFSGSFGPFCLPQTEQEDQATDDDDDLFSVLFEAAPGTSYTVRETVPEGWALLDISCDSPWGVHLNLEAGLFEVQMLEERIITCTFVNARLGSVTIVKETVQGEEEAFVFDGDFGEFTLDTDSDPDSGDTYPDRVEFAGVVPGTYAVGETGVVYADEEDEGDLYRATSIDCVGSPDWSADYPNQRATFEVPPDGAVVCSFLNEELPDVEIRKYEDLDGDGSKDGDEPWLEGWRFKIYDENWNVVAGPLYTDRNGEIEVHPEIDDADLPGTFYVCETDTLVGSGWTNTQPGVSQAPGLWCYEETLDYGYDEDLRFGNTRVDISTEDQLRAAAALGGEYCIDPTNPVLFTSGEIILETTLSLSPCVDPPGPTVAAARALVAPVCPIFGTVCIVGDQTGPIFVVGPGASLTLDRVSVTGGSFCFGGGIIIEGSVTLNGNSTIFGNYAFVCSGLETDGLGGGVIVGDGGSLVMNDYSQIWNNVADGYGGGVFMTGGTVTLNDRANITGNLAYYGGGVAINGGLLNLNAPAGGAFDGGISANSAVVGGGIYWYGLGFGTISGVTATNVVGNTPDNCASVLPGTPVPGCVG